jgi:hypothetical protein
MGIDNVGGRMKLAVVVDGLLCWLPWVTHGGWGLTL